MMLKSRGVESESESPRVRGFWPGVGVGMSYSKETPTLGPDYFIWTFV